MLLTVYVDDITVTGNDDSKIEIVCDQLKSKFEMTDLGQIKSILGIQVEIKDQVVNLSQESYVDSLLAKFGMVDSKPVATPEVIGMVLSPSNLTQDEVTKLNTFRIESLWVVCNIWSHAQDLTSPTRCEYCPNTCRATTTVIGSKPRECCDISRAPNRLA